MAKLFITYLDVDLKFVTFENIIYNLKDIL